MMSAVSDSPARVTISAPPGSGCLPRAGHLGLVTLGGKGYHGEEQARGIEGRKRSAAGYEIVDHGDGGNAFWPYLQYVIHVQTCAEDHGEGAARAEPGRHGGEAGQPARYADGNGGQCGGGDQDQDGDGSRYRRPLRLGRGHLQLALTGPAEPFTRTTE